MTDQEVNPTSSVIVKRTPDGKFAGGNPNPTGANGMKGFARYEIRVEQLNAKYPTCQDLMQFFILGETGQLLPSAKLLEMNAIDAGIIRQLIGQVVGGQTLKERESMWNRMQGKPVETVLTKSLNKLDDIPTEFENVKSAAMTFEDIVKANG